MDNDRNKWGKAFKNLVVSQPETICKDRDLYDVILLTSAPGMEHPDKCEIRKGYFPETTEGIEDKFFFVNLDLDLYQPTLSGLEWFEERMMKGGIILIHDYFAENFTGVKQAVDEYMAQTNKSDLRLMPIGDGISIAITGY